MSEDTQPSPASIDLTRGSHSDRALPGLALVAALVVVVSAALLFIGYRVFQMESQRRAVNEALQELEGRDAAVAEAHERHLELSQLQLQVDAEKAQLGGLRTEAEGLRSQAELQKGQLESGEKNLARLQGQRAAESQRLQELVGKSDRLEDKIEQDLVNAKQAEGAAERSRATRDALLSEASNLQAKVSKLQALRETLRQTNMVLAEDQQQIRQIRDDLREVFDGLKIETQNVNASARSLAATAATLKSTTQKDLRDVSSQLSESADSIDWEVAALHRMADAEQPIAKSRVQIEQASRDLDQAVNAVSDSLGTMERRLDKSIKTISATAARLPTADEGLTSGLRELLAGFEDVRKQSAESSKALRNLSLQVTRAAAAHEDALGKVEGRLRASADRLERVVNEVEGRKTPPPVDPEPAADGVTGEPRL